MNEVTEMSQKKKTKTAASAIVEKNEKINELIKNESEDNKKFYSDSNTYQSRKIVDDFYKKMNERDAKSASMIFIDAIRDSERAILYKYEAPLQCKEVVDDAFVLEFLSDSEMYEYRNANINKIIADLDRKEKIYLKRLEDEKYDDLDRSSFKKSIALIKEEKIVFENSKKLEKKHNRSLSLSYIRAKELLLYKLMRDMCLMKSRSSKTTNKSLYEFYAQYYNSLIENCAFAVVRTKANTTAKERKEKLASAKKK